jgi:hypothetical protein
MIKTEVFVKQVADTDQEVETLNMVSFGEFFCLDTDSDNLYMLIDADHGGEFVFVNMDSPENALYRSVETAKKTIIYRPSKVNITFEMGTGL